MICSTIPIIATEVAIGFRMPLMHGIQPITRGGAWGRTKVMPKAYGGMGGESIVDSTGRSRDLLPQALRLRTLVLMIHGGRSTAGRLRTAGREALVSSVALAVNPGGRGHTTSMNAIAGAEIRNSADLSCR